MLFALCLVPVLGLVGLAIDFAGGAEAKSRYDLAAEVAALTGVRTAANALAANPNTYLALGRDAGLQRFAAQAGAVTTTGTPTINLVLTLSGTTVVAQASWTAAYPTRFGAIFGMASWPLAGTAAANAALGTPYTDVTMLIDISGSMAVASTAAGMAALGTAVRNSIYYTTAGQSQPCAFACHDNAQNKDLYGVARANNIELRFDVINAAMIEVVNAMIASPNAPHFRIALNTLESSLGTVFPLGSNLAAAKVAMAGLTMPLNSNNPNTNFSGVMASLGATMTTAGDGTTQAKARKYLFILTDGVVDYSYSGRRVQSTINPADCAAIKAKGVQIVVIYTVYLPIPTNGWYNTYIAPIDSQIAPQLALCASQPLFFAQASDGPGIQAALRAMLQATIALPTRITQ